MIGPRRHGAGAGATFLATLLVALPGVGMVGCSLGAATPTPPPGPLCDASELVAAVSLWTSIPAGTEGDFIIGSETTGRTCYLHGTAEGQIVAADTVIADSGTASAVASATDPYLKLSPGGKIAATVTWSNWCGPAPATPITIAFVLPAGMGRVVANTSGPTPVPACVSSGSPSAVTAAAWHT